MKKFGLAGITISAVILLVTVPLTSIAGYHSVKASQETEYVDVTSESCGFPHTEKNIVRLTIDQFKILQQYLIDLSSRFNQTQCQEEAEGLVREALAELKTYGLLPQHLSMEQMQRLILKPSCPQFPASPYDTLTITGNKTNTDCILLGLGTWTWAVRYGVNEVMKKLYQIEQEQHSFFLMNLRDHITLMQMAREVLFPFFLGTALYFTPYPGDVVSVGSEGRVTWDGIIAGGYPVYFYRGGYLGVKGFVGLHFTTDQSFYYIPNFTFFLGHAKAVSLSTQ